jgi:putative hydrolase of the HAD superfamily
LVKPDELRAYDHAPTPAVVFDFGAVLFQWQPLAACCRPTVPEPGARDEAGGRGAWRRAIFEKLRARQRLGALSDPGLVEEADAGRSASPRAPGRRRTRDAPGHRRHSRPPAGRRPPTVALLRRLQAAGHAPVLPVEHAAAVRASILERDNAVVLADFDWTGIFSARRGADEAGTPKSTPSLRPASAWSRADTVFIDDHAGNIEAAARAAGRRCTTPRRAGLQGRLQAAGWL